MLFNAAELRSQTAKGLNQTAKAEGLTGYSQLSKDELVETLLRHFRAKQKREARAAKRSAATATARPAAGAKAAADRPAANGVAVPVAPAKAPAKASESVRVTAPKAARSSRPQAVAADAGSPPTKPAPARPAPASASASDPGDAVKPRPSKVAAKPASSQADEARPGASRAETAPANTAEGKPAAAKADRPAAKAPAKAPTRPAGASAEPTARSPEAGGEGTATIRRFHLEQSQQRDITSPPRMVPTTPGLPPQAPVPVTEDRVVLLVRGPYWLQADWDITRTSVDRARAALAEQWHAAIPVLRLLEVESGSSSNERVLRDITIHGGVQSWFIDVTNPPAAFRVVIGYRGPGGKFHAITRSNRVQTPAPGGKGAADSDWADIAEDVDRIFALSTDSETGTSGGMREIFEKRLRRSLAGSIAERITVPGSEDDLTGIDLPLVVDAALVVFGRTQPDARVTISGDPVRIHPDGSFTVKLAMPDRRQVIPVVASTPDGSEQRTVVLAVERNTKIMERRHREELD